jgi:peptidoglycan/LPS O-acetylase OafA/YrhL
MRQELSVQRTLSLNDNGYDALRLVLAAMVVYSHSYFVGHYGPEPLVGWSKEGLILGELGVLGFFALSGFLVSASAERSRSAFAYLLKRARRIFPGFWVCLAITAFVIAPLIWIIGGRSFSEFPWSGPQGAWSYIVANFFLRVRQHSIRDVLQSPAYPDLNGSLWSLFPEFLCYLAVLVLLLGGALGRSRWLLAGVTTGAFIFHVLGVVVGSECFPLIPSFYAFSNWSPFMTAFCFGACAFVWKDSLFFTPKTVLALGVLAAVAIKFGGFKIMSPLLVSALVLCAGSCFKMRLKTDLSYGIYIYSFPCQQLLFALGLASLPVSIFIGASLVLSAGCAWMSWNFVERPALGRG